MVPVAYEYYRFAGPVGRLEHGMAVVLRFDAAYRDSVFSTAEPVAVKYFLLTLRGDVADHLVASVGYHLRRPAVDIGDVFLDSLVVGYDMVGAKFLYLAGY